MSASAKGKQQNSSVRDSVLNINLVSKAFPFLREKPWGRGCIEHIPYYLSGLSRAQFFRQPFSK